MTEAPPEVTWWNPFSWRRGQEYADATDARVAELNEQSRDVYGDDWFAEVTDNLAASRVDVAGEILDEFDSQSLGKNLQESATKAGQSVGGVAGSIVQGAGNFVGNVLLGFPVWFWLVVAVGVFFYLGGGNIIRARVARASA